MKLNDAFPSKYLKADEDVTEEGLTLVIKSVEIEDVGQQKEEKLVMAFRGQDKTLVVNKTNATTIAVLYGDDTDDWVGKPITLYATDTQYQGKPCRGIRVRSRKPSTPKPAPMPVAAEEGDDIPF